MFVYYLNQGGEVFLSTLSQGPFYSNGLIWSILVFFLGSLVTAYWEKFKDFSGVFAHNISFLVGILIGVIIKFGG